MFIYTNRAIPAVIPETRSVVFLGSFSFLAIVSIWPKGMLIMAFDFLSSPSIDSLEILWTIILILLPSIFVKMIFHYFQLLGLACWRVSLAFCPPL